MVNIISSIIHIKSTTNKIITIIPYIIICPTTITNIVTTTAITDSAILAAVINACRIRTVPD